MAISPVRSCLFGLAVFALSSLGAPPPASADAPPRSPPHAPPPSTGQEPAAEDVTDEAAASALEAKAAQAATDGKKREAADLFEQAWKRYPLGSFICNRGMLLYELGLLREAAESLEICIRPSTDFGSTPKIEQALKKVAAERFKRARAELCTISVSVNVPNAEIFVDDRSIGREPLEAPVFLAPGTHIAEAHADNYVLDAKGSACPKGMWWEVALKLYSPLKPGAVMTAPRPSPNEFKVGVQPTTVGPQAGLFDTQPSNGDPSGSNRNMLAIFAGGAMTLSGAGLAIGSFVAASSKGAAADDAEAAITSQDPAKACNGPTPDFKCGELNAKVNANRDSATVFTALGVGASVLSAGGIALTIYAIVDNPKKPGAPSASIRVTPGIGSLAVAGRF